MKTTKVVAGALAAVCVLGFVGCEKVSTAKFNEGVYEAEVTDPYNNENNTASAKVTVNREGKIESVYLDTTYTTTAGEKTTKKTLGDDYNMKKYMPNAQGEWYEQVEKLEKAIVENQGTEFITLKDDSTTDTVSGCTIKVDALKEAATKAIEKAVK